MGPLEGYNYMAGGAWICNSPNLWENCDDPDYNCYFGGTSAACPIVAGVATLLLARDSTLAVQEVYDIIKLSAVPVLGLGAGAKADTATRQWGRVDALRAMLAITRGDANNDGRVNVGDAVYIINYIFKGGAAPQPHELTGDANCDGLCDVGDAIYIIAFVFEEGPPPSICFEY